MHGDPELEEEQQRWREWRAWHLEKLHRVLPYRLICIDEAWVEAQLRRMKSPRSRLRLKVMAESMLRGECSVCQAFILYPAAAMPSEPLKVCLPCARLNLHGGDLLFVGSPHEQPTVEKMKPARRRRPRPPHVG